MGGVHKTYTSYYIETYNYALGYLVDELRWVREVLDDVGILGWTVIVDTYLDGSNKATIYICSPLGEEPTLDIVGPEHLWWAWWLDPTLSYEEAIPMYALLIALDKVGTKSDIHKLIKVLEIGWYCKHKTPLYWSTMILQQTDCPLRSKYRTLKTGRVLATQEKNTWVEDIHPLWVDTMANIYKWLEE